MRVSVCVCVRKNWLAERKKCCNFCSGIIFLLLLSFIFHYHQQCFDNLAPWTFIFCFDYYLIDRIFFFVHLKHHDNENDDQTIAIDRKSGIFKKRNVFFNGIKVDLMKKMMMIQIKKGIFIYFVPDYIIMCPFLTIWFRTLMWWRFWIPILTGNFLSLQRNQIIGMMTFENKTRRVEMENFDLFNSRLEYLPYSLLPTLLPA